MYGERDEWDSNSLPFLCVFSWELPDSFLNEGGGWGRGKQVFFGHV